MRDTKTIPQFYLHVFGDWLTVVSASHNAPFYEEILAQNPMDEDMAHYSRYRVPCNTSAELMNAYHTFASKELACEFAVVVKSEEVGCEVFAATGTGYTRKPEPYSQVDVNETRVSAAMAGAIQSAIETLSKAR